MLIRFWFLLMVLFLHGCGSSSYVPVEDLGQNTARSGPARLAGAPTYTVVKGDTLFSIALRHDLDYRKLARANNIYPPYTIRPNDVIYLREAPVPAQVSASSSSRPVSAYRTNNPVVDTGAKKTGVVPGKGVKENSGSSKLQGVNKAADATSVLPLAGKKQPFFADSPGGWIWPVEGNILRQFSPQDALSKGIDIGAAEGAQIKAARTGEVVYAGSGLKGYGNLIIIRHDDTYISAYAHNRRILVAEGQAVRQGETIAELGMTGTQSPKLHFEIRENGKPVNPLTLLPVKK